MNARLAIPALLFVVLAGSDRSVAGDTRDEAEVGIQIGAYLPDEDLTGEPGTLDAVEPTIGFRGDLFFAPRWGWFVDALLASPPTPFGDADQYVARTGFEVLCLPHGDDYQTFFEFGGGWTIVNGPGAADFDRALVSLGLGQRFGYHGNTVWRWEVRGDHTVTSDGLGGDDLTTAYALFGVGWGVPSRARDWDKDGVADRKDDCPGTPVGARVDGRGCPIDSDGDGVVDGVDECPGTPAGTAVDERGCPRDSDGDGVDDGADRCPETPAGMKVDARGCPIDTDGDGVTDDRDTCPDTPAGARVDSKGCPIDSDGDGVYDGIDKCPGTPVYAHVDDTGCPNDGDGDGVYDGIDRCPTTAAGVSVNSDGCPKAAPLFQEKRDTLVLEGVHFDTGKATLTENSKTILDIVARSLTDWPEVKVEVGGHTDSVGSDKTNNELSQRRAESVRAYLIECGIAADRLTARGYGKTKPIADNGTAAGREKNRRVELKRRP
jgi:outer membrane protein OmpA-like peptidoglycan-associated protein